MELSAARSCREFHFSIPTWKGDTMSKPSLKLCPDPELQEFVRRLAAAIGEVLREIRLPGNPSLSSKRVDLNPNLTPRRQAGRAAGLAYGNLERIETGSVQPRLRTLQLAASGIGSSLPTLIARAWWRTLLPEHQFPPELVGASAIMDRLTAPAVEQLPDSLGRALGSFRGAFDPLEAARRAKLSACYYLQLERGERNGSLWAFVSATHALGTSLPALLFVAWTQDRRLKVAERELVTRARNALSAQTWR